MTRIPARAARAMVLVGLAATLLVGAPSQAASPDSTGNDPPLLDLTKNDAWYWLGAGAATGAAAFADIRVREQAQGWNSDGERRLASVVKQLPLAAGTAAVLGYLGGRAFDNPELEDASRRIGISMAVAAVATAAIKWPVGRVRPDESDTEVETYKPFSGHGSFPSGHTALSFAWATAVDRETDEGWVPWVVYPLATLVGWSRVRDDRHWASDVVAGAALGGWTAWKTEDYLRARDGVDPSPLGGGPSSTTTLFAVHVKF